MVDHRLNRSPGQRFRFEQYLSYLSEAGFEFTISNLLNEKDDKIFYSDGNYFRKLLLAFKIIFIRIRDLFRSMKYDYIFIFRAAWFFGSTIIEKLMHKWSKAKLIFDFDDSIWVLLVSKNYRFLAWLKGTKKTGRIIKLCDLVIAGNDYLADYARRFSDKVVIIPTTIDTVEYHPVPVHKSPGKLTIGWSGSKTTIQHFETAIPILKRVVEKYKDLVELFIIGDGSYSNKELEIISKDWKIEDEMKDLSSFDIGIMPLPDDEWSRGKCGLKGLQYMALGIPTVMSAVGVNKEIIRDGVNGFLASTEDEWVEKLSRLIESAELRKKLGAAGVETVQEKYSVVANKNAWLQAFQT